MAGVPSSSDVGAKGGAVSPPSRHRTLKGRAEFERVLRDGRRRRGGGITVLRAAGSLGTARVGYVVGRRVGSAVTRNRAKRRLRDAAARVPLQDGVDYIIIASESVLDAGFPTLVEWIRSGAEGE